MAEATTHLFLDDVGIADKHRVTRSGAETQLYLFGSVLHEPEPGGNGEAVFRMWYYAVGEGRHWTGYARSRQRPPDLVARGGPAYVGRAIGRGSSRDFRTWSDEWPLVMQATPDDPDGTEIYGWSAYPYAGQWVALTQMHHSLPHLGFIDMAVSHSRDGLHWQREPHTVLPVGEVGDWDRFNQCTSNHLLRVGTGLWIYYSGRSYRHREYRAHLNWQPEIPRDDNGPSDVGIGLATMRLDGWCSLDAGYGGGTVLTNAAQLPQRDLWLNAKADWGKVVVEVLDAAGQPLAGSQPSLPISADEVRLPVVWPEAGRPAWRTDRPVRLRFALENARLYSWGWGD